MADRFAVCNEITAATTTPPPDRRLGQDLRPSPRFITPNHHIGQLGWLKLTVS